MSPQTAPATAEQTWDTYVSRLRARLSRPKITVADARDGMLDCFVSTYHAGVEHGLKGILGVDASADQVGAVASKMFRDRLAERGSSFDAPSIDALNEVKEELDGEFHFTELPVEVSATHDQVCSLLLAKADGLIEHDGDRSIVRAPASKPAVAPPPGVSTVRPPVRIARQPVAATAPGSAASNSVTASLRAALDAYLRELLDATATADPAELLARLDRARSLVQSISDFQGPG